MSIVRKVRSKQALNTWIQRLSELELEGITNRRVQAEALGVSYATHMRRLAQAGLTEPRPVRPQRPGLAKWGLLEVEKAHRTSPVARKLQILKRATFGEPEWTDTELQASIRWAQELVDVSFDIEYTQRQGFRTVHAIWDDWLLKRLLDEVLRLRASS